MNGRILSSGWARTRLAEGLLAGPVRSGLAGDWMLSMWNDLVVRQAGNLYVPDDKPRIWRVSPDGTAPIWFTDPRLTGLFGFAGGPLGGRIDPTGQWLYISITLAAEFAPRPTRRSTGSVSSTIRPPRTCSSSIGSRPRPIRRSRRRRRRASPSRSPATCT